LKISIDHLVEKTMAPNRIVALSDGIFAIVMTILILDVKLPDMGYLSEEELRRQLLQSLPKFELLLFSFMILGIFWIIHHSHFHYIKRTDPILLWINIFLLMFVCILPFSTDICGEHESHWIPCVIFTANMLIINLFKNLNWWYATRNHRLVSPDLDNNYISYVNRNGLIASGVFLLAFILAVLNLPIYKYVYLLIPVALLIHRNKTLKIETSADNTEPENQQI